MKFAVFGSMNIDKVYSLSHLPETGETLTCTEYSLHVGGKGLNQSVSLKKAGAAVFMAGCTGKDGQFLLDFLNRNSVDTHLCRLTDGFSGHAVIEVDPDGQNQMILFAGANREIDESYCDGVLSELCEGDLVLMQYETSCVEYMAKAAHEKGVKTAFNPSPFVDELKSFDYGVIDYLVLNEFEGQSITGLADSGEAARALAKRVAPGGAVILTLGADGAVFASDNKFLKVPAFKVNAVDTTGAGDTFTGYSLFALMNGEAPEAALTKAAAASALAVMKTGAAETIPEKTDVEEFLKIINKAE